MKLMASGVALAGISAAIAAGASSQDPTDEQRAIDPADQAAVRAIVIQPSDVPGWRPFARYPAAGGECPNFDPDKSVFTLTGEYRGRQFTRRKGSVDEVFTSAAWAYATEADAHGEFRIDTSAAAVACLRDQLSKSAPSGSINVTARVVPLRLPRVAPRQFARRYRLIWFTGGDIGNIYLDDILLGRSRAEVSLIVQRVGEADAPPTATLERRLTRQLGQRLAREFP
jgi:hypothetical protein